MARYAWATWGDVNAFFGLMLDNVTVMLALTLLLTAGSGPAAAFTPEFVLTHMIPGSALGVLVGDLVYTLLAFRLARRTGRSDVTAMPLGLDTPSVFGVALLVLLPTLKEAQERGLTHEAAMVYAWHVGAVVLVLVGVFKSLCAPFGNRVRQWVPRAGLLGSLAATALALIAFLPLVDEVAKAPAVGLPALAVILVTLVAHRRLPGNFPGALAAVLVGVVIHRLMPASGPPAPSAPVPPPGTGAGVVLFPAIDWALAWRPALASLPLILPFAIATLVGGIDCTESAAAAGDEYDTRVIVLTEGVASLAAGLCGGVLQNVPYIGHPAYKAMGGRAAYTLATALFVAAAGYFGWFAHLFDWLPPAAMFPILIFVGLEITAQSFHATPTRHYPALALAVLPALAQLVTILARQVLGGATPAGHGADLLRTLDCLGNGFIVTSLLWGAALAALLDARPWRCAAYLVVAGVFALFGIIHSPLPEAPIALPATVIDRLPAGSSQTPYHWAAAYAVAALLVVGLGTSRTEASAPARAETAA